VKRFLVVEDDPAIGRMLTLLIQHDGHRAVAVTSATEALDHLRAHHVDFVLSELRIGSSMDGLQLSACVRREWPLVQFVLGTRSLDVVLARRQRAEMILTKPYRLADCVRSSAHPPIGGTTRSEMLHGVWLTESRKRYRVSDSTAGARTRSHASFTRLGAACSALRLSPGLLNSRKGSTPNGRDTRAVGRPSVGLRHGVRRRDASRAAPGRTKRLVGGSPGSGV
jgi:CheY-like chemotaxis protein